MALLEGNQKQAVSIHNIKKLFEQYPTEASLLKQINTFVFPESKVRAIRTIGVFYPRVYQGGAERVISLQIPIFLKLGYRIVLFTAEVRPEKEYPIDPAVTRVTLPRNIEDGRAEAFLSALQKNSVDVFIHHDSSGATILQDLMLLKVLGIYSVVVRHILTVLNMVRLNERVARCHKIFKLADKVIVLSSMEEAFYRLMGCHAKYLPNPVKLDIQPEEDITERRLILWVGRLDRLHKNYHDALDIMQLVVKKHPEALMVILGAEDRPGAAKEIRNFIRNKHLEKNIQWHDHVLDVAAYYRQARVHLVTSTSESFSMTIVESKSFSIPLVTYDMPYLELLKNGQGYLSVRQRDITGAAEAIIRLFDDDSLCQRLSVEARQSVEPFLAFDQEQAWKEIFLSIERKDISSEERKEINNRDIKTFMETLMEHYERGCIARKRDGSSIGNRLKYFKYSLLSKITSGKRKERYHNKSIEYRNKV